MALFNYATKEITLKIVYYGPGLSGKTTNIQHLHAALNAQNKGKLLSLSTESDRTLFFDFLPIELGKIKEFSIRFQLYTVPGQVRYNATRKVVLKGADAVVFVADSQREMREQNIESFENMRDNLIANNINPDGIPVVLQYNKRDLKNILTIDELNADINKNHTYDITEAEAINGKGVEDTFQLITRLVLKDIARKHKIEIQPAPLKEETIQEEKIAVINKTVIESFQPDAEAEIFESTSYELEEESEELFEPECELEEELKETLAVKEILPDIEPRLRTEYTTEKNVFTPTVEETRECKESTVVSDNRIKMIAADVAKLNMSLLDLKGAVTSLKADIIEIRNNVTAIKENAATREDKRITEMRKDQREIRSILSDIAAMFSEVKVKKRWFKF